MSLIERWECQRCGQKKLPGDHKPRRDYHYWRGERCEGEWLKVEYVPASQLAGAVSAERARNAALVRALANNSWVPRDETLLMEVARQIAASGGQ